MLSSIAVAAMREMRPQNPQPFTRFQDFESWFPGIFKDRLLPEKNPSLLGAERQQMLRSLKDKVPTKMTETEKVDILACRN